MCITHCYESKGTDNNCNLNAIIEICKIWWVQNQRSLTYTSQHFITLHGNKPFWTEHSLEAFWMQVCLWSLDLFSSTFFHNYKDHINFCSPHCSSHIWFISCIHHFQVNLELTFTSSQLCFTLVEEYLPQHRRCQGLKIPFNLDFVQNSFLSPLHEN